MGIPSSWSNNRVKSHRLPWNPGTYIRSFSEHSCRCSRSYKTVELYNMLCAYQQPQSLETLEYHLLNDTSSAKENYYRNSASATNSRVIWTGADGDGKYNYYVKPRYSLGHLVDILRNRRLSDARLKWGNLLEPTAVLAAINAMAQYSKRSFSCKEVGLCTSEALLDEAKVYGLNGIERKQVRLLEKIHAYGGRLGASPDALFEFDDDTTEVLEVKNKFPFFLKNGKTFWKHKDSYNLHMTTEIWEMPQIQFQIFLAGFKCKCAMYLRLTHDAGAKFCRIRRDDVVIVTILELIVQFYERYVKRKIRPGTNWSYKNKLVRKLEAKLSKMSNPSRKFTYKFNANLKSSSIQRMK
eukprot:augustus_masked-scaffold_1-processed-gene-24.6-mRNA-1 protein AED:1.00 eAED:1.00 QI:0/-1/0/0/-1/1/1/0/352